ncbi:hypothetical protein EI94DRAFT_1730251 [Lactarius quietus]|nr:hypothetical protein EI94DRAFT_1730251 [Lactarius quietus]
MDSARNGRYRIVKTPIYLRAYGVQRRKDPHWQTGEASNNSEGQKYRPLQAISP